MIPGELITDEGVHTLNPGRRTITWWCKTAATGPFKWARIITLQKPTVHLCLIDQQPKACA